MWVYGPDNIRMDLQEVGCGYMDWIILGWISRRWDVGIWTGQY